MTITEIGQGLVSLCKAGQFGEAMARYYSPDIVSVEAGGEQAEVRGIEAVQAKGQWFMDNHELHGGEVEGPYVNGDQFVVRFKIEITPKATGKRVSMDETGVYTVQGDKIVHERFFPLAGQGAE
jgi:ketosteroid isomerase-like protein